MKFRENNNNEKIDNLNNKNKNIELELKDINDIGNKRNQELKKLQEE